MEYQLDYKTHNAIKLFMLKYPHLLNEDEEMILRMRYGLKDGLMHTQEEVAKHYDIPVEGVRELEKSGLETINLEL